MSNDKNTKPSKPPETKPNNPTRDGKFSDNTLPTFHNPPPPPPPKEKK